MREYELTVVFDLSVAESGGADAAPDIVTTLVEARKGKVLKHDHWGRRRMAYPINHALDADYVVSRVELDPAEVTPLEAALRIDERVYRHLVVRADELPVPPPPREPRPERVEAPAAQPAATDAATAAVADPSPVATPAPATDETVEPVVPPAEPAAITPAASEEGEPPAPSPDVTTPVTEAPPAAVESAATEAETEAAADAGSSTQDEDEAPSA